jgi:SAM-dependent methyltransferase
VRVVSTPRSNSLNLVGVEDVERAPGAPCPLCRSDAAPSLLERADPARAVFVRLRDRMRLFRSDTRDFSDAELVRIKQELGQIYADISAKLAPDDFSKDLRKLELLDECRACERRPECAGCYRMSEADVFSRDDARVREILRSLEGDVLDVGCGEGSYLGELEPTLSAGRARYLGLDPDSARVSLLRSRYPWAEYEVGTLEDAGARARRFDHVLFLRSYNHLPDPDRAIGHALELLDVGGTLLLVDNVAFALLRTREQALRAEGGAAVFEHYRNESSEEACARFAGRAVKLIERQDVAPSTSNQWLLRFERTSAAASGAS